MTTESSDKIWYYAENGQQTGPFTVAEMRAHLSSGTIGPDTPCWKNGMADWQSIGQLPEFAAAAQDNAPPPPPLKLGGPRQFSSVNQPGDKEAPPVEVGSMLGANRGSLGTSKLLTQPKPGFFESIGLGSFESAFFAVTLVLGIVAGLVFLGHRPGIVAGLGGLWMLIAGCALIVRAFLKHWIWGLVYLFVPFGGLVYIIVDLKNAGKSVLLWIVGLGAILATPHVPGFEESPMADFFQQVEEHWQQSLQQYQEELQQQREERVDPLPQ